MLSIAGFFWLFAWARRHRQTYGDEPAPHGGRTPRWYIRVPILAAYLYFELILAITHTWLALLFLVVRRRSPLDLQARPPAADGQSFRLAGFDRRNGFRLEAKRYDAAAFGSLLSLTRGQSLSSLA
jgi:hypothetical protein